jgi:hypothetical protein
LRQGHRFGGCENVADLGGSNVGGNPAVKRNAWRGYAQYYSSLVALTHHFIYSITSYRAKM